MAPEVNTWLDQAACGVKPGGARPLAAHQPRQVLDPNESVDHWGNGSEPEVFTEVDGTLATDPPCRRRRSGFRYADDGPPLPSRGCVAGDRVSATPTTDPPGDRAGVSQA